MISFRVGVLVIIGESENVMASQPTPPNVPPPEIRPYDQGLLTVGFPLIRPAIKPLFLGGGTWPGGSRLTIAMTSGSIKGNFGSSVLPLVFSWPTGWPLIRFNR